MPTRVPLLRSHALVVVWVTVNGTADLRIAVDAGSVFTIISQRAAARTGLTLSGPFHQIPLVTAERVTAPVTLGRLDSLQIGAVSLQNVEAGIAQLPAVLDIDGILGLSFLRHFRVTFEFDTASLVLREPPPAGRASR